MLRDQIVIVNAGGALFAPEAIATRLRAARPQFLVVLNLNSPGRPLEPLAEWLDNVTAAVARHSHAVVFFDSDVALASGGTVPRKPGVSFVSESVRLVTRSGVLRDEAGAASVFLVGPVRTNPLVGFHGSLWSQDLFGPEDLESCVRAPVLLADCAFPLITGPMRSDRRSAVDLMLERVRPRLIWCRAADGQPGRRGFNALAPGRTASITLPPTAISLARP